MEALDKSLDMEIVAREQRQVHIEEATTVKDLEAVALMGSDGSISTIPVSDLFL